ncbi:MAG: hypothetical protein D6721_04950 [Gammaproteobacteria bacterium]|nr:MAG: hypothetical protein D6721_04950 [Gammaproteobacteria bacterium]
MEFFCERDCACAPQRLHQVLRIDNLPAWCEPVERVLEAAGEQGRIWTLWGEFAVRREPLRYGVRFTLPECPNALQWTVTAENEKEVPLLRVHATINRATHDAEFIETLERMARETCRSAAALLASVP